MITDKSNIIGALAQFGEIEWAKTHDINWATDPKNPNYGLPPLIVWRYKSRTIQLATQLSDIVSAFEGEVKWIFEAPENARNWSIHPVGVCDFETIRKLKQSTPDYGVTASKELAKLAGYLYLESEKIKLKGINSL